MVEGDEGVTLSEPRKRVLIVDDEETMLFALQELLESPDTVVDGVSTKDEAMELLRKRHYAAVVADLRLSGIDDRDGFAIVREAKRLDPSTTTVIVTAYGGIDARVEASRLKIDYYLEKPVSPDLLRRIIDVPQC